jgi:protein gp37
LNTPASNATGTDLFPFIDLFAGIGGITKTTKIEWTDRTWNPAADCTKVSMGCVDCCAEITASRLCVTGREKYKNGFTLAPHEDKVSEGTG